MSMKSLARTPSAPTTGNVLSFSAAHRLNSLTQADRRAAAILQECMQTQRETETPPQGAPTLGYFLSNGWAAV